MAFADEIFGLGSELERAMREKRESRRVIEFRVGVADSVAKALAYRLIEPAFSVSRSASRSCSCKRAGIRRRPRGFRATRGW